MTYLLDVSALVALGVAHHEFHARMASWFRATKPKLATCPITELGFVRILSQAPVYGFTVVQARALLLHLKQERTSRLSFFPDDLDISHLPGWVGGPKQVTDGHLSMLAAAHDAILATLDENIPGSYVIPR